MKLNQRRIGVTWRDYQGEVIVNSCTEFSDSLAVFVLASRDTVFRWRATVDARSRAHRFQRRIEESGTFRASFVVSRKLQPNERNLRFGEGRTRCILSIRSPLFLLLASTEAASGFFDPVDPPPGRIASRFLRKFFASFGLVAARLNLNWQLDGVTNLGDQLGIIF